MCVFARVASWCFRFFLVVFLSVCPLAAGGRQMVRKSYCFQAFFLRFAFFAFSVPFLCLLSVRPAVREFEFCFLPFFLFALCFGIQTPLF